MIAPDDLIRLRHMRDACYAAARVSNGMTREALGENETVVLALSRTIEIVGEAAARITKPLGDEHPEIPWARIVGMRNRLIHAYFDVDLNQLWKTATEDLPPLVAELEKIIPPDDPAI